MCHNKGMKISGLSIKEIRRFKQQKKIPACLSEDLPFSSVSFEKNEEIIHQISPRTNLLFLCEGTIRISSIRADGSYYPVAVLNGAEVLGDLEFFLSDVHEYTVEAITGVRIVVLPLHGIRKKLLKDPALLSFLATSLAMKMQSSSMDLSEPADLKEKLLYYLKEKWNGTLKGTGRCADAMHCSRRQLQRVLAELVQDGTLRKTGKGVYELI